MSRSKILMDRARNGLLGSGWGFGEDRYRDENEQVTPRRWQADVAGGVERLW